MRNTKLLITFLIIGFLVLLLLVFLNLNQKTDITPQPTPSPSFTNIPVIPVPSFGPIISTSQPIPTTLPASFRSKQDLVNTTPLTTDNFDIEYLALDDEFVITIKNSPLEENKQLALDFLEDRGINPESIKILWNNYRGVQ